MNLQNLIDYCKIYNLPDPLSGISVPQPIDADRVRSAIMMRCGLLEPVYPQPEVFQQILAQWFANRTWNFEHLINIIRSEYSPIENTDKYSEWTQSKQGSDSTIHSGSDVTTKSGNDKNVASGQDTTSGSGSDSSTRTPNLTSIRTDEISAENASGYQADAKHTDTDTGTETTAGQHSDSNTTTYGKTDTFTSSGREELAHGHRETNEYDSAENYVEHTHGNIGVTTNQQMITEELDLIRRFNIYDWIAERVEADLFIMVY